MTWKAPTWKHLIPTGGGGSKVPTIWEIGVPDPITGTGITTEYGPYIDLDPPLDILSGYIIVPGMRLHSPNGISLRGAIELWDASELIHEEDIATLSAVIPPEEPGVSEPCMNPLPAGIGVPSATQSPVNEPSLSQSTPQVASPYESVRVGGITADRVAMSSSWSLSVASHNSIAPRRLIPFGLCNLIPGTII